MKREDWLLLAISSAKGEALSPVQLQKTLFLLGQTFPEEVGGNYYDFVPYNYGPFDAAVYSDAESLAAQGLAIATRPPGRRWVEHAATPAAMKRAEELKEEAPEHAVAYLEAVVTWARSLTFPELVRTIYHLYPEYRKNSVFQD